MNDKLTIELLCEMLEEQSLSCHTHYLHAFWWVGSKLYEAADNLDGTLTVGRLTPEQAIAATLGSGTCEMVLMWSDYEDGECYKCSKCSDFAFTHGGEPRFCPNCGVKVD